MGNELHRDRVERATEDTLERVERALRDLGLNYLPLRVRDAIVDGMQWAYRAASRPDASIPHRGHALDRQIKRLPAAFHQQPRAAQQNPVREKFDHRSAILPTTPVKRASLKPKPDHLVQVPAEYRGPDKTHRPRHILHSPILPPPSPRAHQTTMEIRPEDWILPGDDDPTDPMIRKPKS